MPTNSVNRLMFTKVYLVKKICPVQKHLERGCTNLRNNAQQRATTRNKGFNIDKIQKQKYFWDPWTKSFSENIRKIIFIIKHVCSCLNWNWAVCLAQQCATRVLALRYFKTKTIFEILEHNPSQKTSGKIFSTSYAFSLVYSEIS